MLTRQDHLIKSIKERSGHMERERDPADGNNCGGSPVTVTTTDESLMSGNASVRKLGPWLELPDH